MADHRQCNPISGDRDDPLRQVFIARQPIRDIDGKLFGYELLCRDRADNLAMLAA